MILIKGFLTGLSAGVFCLSWCVPIYFSVLSAEKRNFKQIWIVYLKFSLGRLIAYILFGIIVGYFSKFVSSHYFQLFANFVLILLSFLLIGYALGLSIPKSKVCSIYKKIQPPFLFGFLTGINICPPFLIAIFYVAQIGGAINGLLFFLGFFMGTAIYLAPITFLGLLTKKKIFVKIARMSAILVGLIFLYFAIGQF